MRCGRYSLMVSASALLSGCAHPAGGGNALRSPHELTYGTQVGTGPCVAGAEAVPFLATLAGALISQGVSRIGKELEGAAAKDTQKTLARRNLELSEKGLGPCIVVARGWFYKKEPTGVGITQATFNPKSEFPIKDDPGMGELWNMGLYLAATPDFYFQGRLVPNANRSAYTVLPIHATLDRPLLAHSMRSNRRGVTIAFGLASGGASAISSGGSTVVLGELRPGVLAKFPAATCMVTRVVKTQDGEETQTKVEDCPSGPTPPSDVVRITRTPFESEWFTPGVSKELKPMTLLAEVTEVRNPSRFLEFVAALFKDVQPTMTTALQRELVPALGAEAAETALAAEEAADTAYDKALVEAYTALTACVAAPADISKRSAARAAARSLIAAARKAKKSISLNSGHVEAIQLRIADAAPCEAARGILPSS